MIGIIGAMEDEVKILHDATENKTVKKFGIYEFFTGRINGRDITLLQCGIGKVNAAVGCAMLINEFKPDCVINTGSAGGIKKGLTVGDVIISTGLIYHDVDVTAFNYLPGQLPGQPQIFKADEKLIEISEEAIDELKQEKILPASLNHCRGLIGSGDIFVHKPQMTAHIQKTFPEIAAVEMESAAIAHCCHLFSVPFIVIRALSDVAGTESPVSFNEFLPIAAKHSAHVVMRIVKQVNGF